jgi:hypothetical protein
MANSAMQTMFHDAMKQVIFDKPEDPLRYLADLFQEQVTKRDATSGAMQTMQTP